MKPATKAKVQKFFKVTHGWLGAFVFPWILLIGITGLYLNHSKLVLGWIGSNEYDESQFANWPVKNVSNRQAWAIAQSYYPDEIVLDLYDEPYHGHPCYNFEKDSATIIVTKDTGHYYIKTDTTRLTYAPDGTLLHKKIYWGAIFKWLHARGWLTTTPGTWIADITATAMVFFSISGLWLFFAPRMKKIARGLKKLRPKRKPSS